MPCFSFLLWKLQHPTCTHLNSWELPTPSHPQHTAHPLHSKTSLLSPFHLPHISEETHFQMLEMVGMLNKTGRLCGLLWQTEKFHIQTNLHEPPRVCVNCFNFHIQWDSNCHSFQSNALEAVDYFSPIFPGIVSRIFLSTRIHCKWCNTL